MATPDQSDENGGERARRQQRVLSLLLDLLDDSGVLRSREYSSRRDVAGYASSGGWNSSSDSQSAEEPELWDAMAHPQEPPTDLASNFSAGSSTDAPGGDGGVAACDSDVDDDDDDDDACC